MYIKYHDNGGNINYYYDSNDRLLNYSSQVETVHCMYKKINSKKYICYYLSKNNENYTLQTAIDFLEDNRIIKREILNIVGYFDEESFGKGYGEENDFSFR